MGDCEYKSPVTAEQEKAAELATICNEILRTSRNELYLNMRFLDVALSSLAFDPDFTVKSWGVDGFFLKYNPSYVAEAYKNGRIYVNRAYLHMVLHCLFVHMDGQRELEKEYFHLACDIAVESMIDGLYHKCLHRTMSPVRREFYTNVKDQVKVMNAESIYRYLLKKKLSQDILKRLEAEFLVDDHSLWNQQNKSRKGPQRKNKWDEMRNQMQTEMEAFSKEASDDSKSLLDQVRIENRERYDYRKFLRKFAVMKETMEIDADSFDYIYYNYGIGLYGNMPLIEPLETKEIKRIEEFVIVIDTSMSCSKDLVEKFLEETYTILGQAESYFTKIHVHIIQCDEKVQQDQVISCLDELKEYMDHLNLSGQGGTDFRPAFQYVDDLIAKEVFHKLKGLIYFTDGYGRFPVKIPQYDTTFVFMKDDYTDVDVPTWAIKIILDPDELRNEREVEV